MPAESKESLVSQKKLATIKAARSFLEDIKKYPAIELILQQSKELSSATFKDNRDAKEIEEINKSIRNDLYELLQLENVPGQAYDANFYSTAHAVLLLLAEEWPLNERYFSEELVDTKTAIFTAAGYAHDRAELEDWFLRQGKLCEPWNRVPLTPTQRGYLASKEVFNNYQENEARQASNYGFKVGVIVGIPISVIILFGAAIVAAAHLPAMLTSSLIISTALGVALTGGLVLNAILGFAPLLVGLAGYFIAAKIYEYNSRAKNNNDLTSQKLNELKLIQRNFGQNKSSSTASLSAAIPLSRVTGAAPELGNEPPTNNEKLEVPKGSDFSPVSGLRQRRKR